MTMMDVVRCSVVSISASLENMAAYHRNYAIGVQAGRLTEWVLYIMFVDLPENLLWVPQIVRAVAAGSCSSV